MGQEMSLETLSENDKKMLMELQYNFPFDTIDPYSDAAARLGISVDGMLARLRELKNAGIVKRIGFYVNPRSRRRTVSLIAFKGGDADTAAKLCGSDDSITHCYERSGGGEWRIWIVRRAPSRETLLEWASQFARKIGADSFEILEAVRLYRLSVKYDLYRGVSRAGPYTRVSLNPPSPEELGIDPQLPLALKSLPLEPRPYHIIAEKFGIRPEEIPKIVKMLLDEGVLGDPGLVLDGHRLGFSYNGMVVVKTADSLEDVCDKITRMIPEATHIVARRPYPSDTRATWAPACYAMIHAVSEQRLREVYSRIESIVHASEVYMLVSIRDLKPGAER